MQEVLLGVKEGDLSTFAMDVLTVADDISDIFSKIDSKIESLKNCFDGQKCQNVISAYADLRSNYSAVKDSIISYSDDLIALINKVRSGDNHIAFLINQITEDTKNEAKRIESL